jgi:lactate permease
MEWVQTYDPAGSMLVSTLVAGLPIVLLLGLLVCGLSAPRAAMAGLAAALLVAVWFFKMPPSAALAAAGCGGCFGLFPIGWIVLSAVFLFHLTVRSGQFDIVKRSVAAISPDRRMQALLIAFAFGTFLEGAAGFGTPVAISAALLIGIGFSPLYAACLALIANTSPVAFGGLGTPIITLAKMSGLNEMALSQVAGQQLTLFSLIIPAWLVAVMSGWKGVKGCWPAILVCGGSFAALQFALSNFHGPALVDVVGGVGCLVALTVLLRFWQPQEIWRFPDEQQPLASAELPLRGRQIAYAWTPWLLLSVMVFLWGSWKETLNGGSPQQPNVLAGISKISVDVPGLHRLVYRTRPVVQVAEGSDRAAAPEDAVYELNWLSATGTAIFLAAVLSAFWLRIKPVDFFRELGSTLFRVRWALLTIACMLALAFTTKYSGADATLGLAFTKAGPLLYPFFAPLLGWLGVALTGSDTSANALFGSLQRITAERLGLSPVLIVASNSTGGVMGKMIDAQSIVVAAVATQQSGHEGQILRFVFLHSLVLACLVGLVTLLQAHVLPWMIPAG